MPIHQSNKKVYHTTEYSKVLSRGTLYGPGGEKSGQGLARAPSFYVRRCMSGFLLATPRTVVVRSTPGHLVSFQ